VFHLTLSLVAFSERDAGGCSAAKAFLTFCVSGRSLTEIYLEDGKTHNQTDHILIDRRQHLSKLDVRYFRRADCETYHCLVGTNVRERLAVNRQAAQMFNVELSEL